MAEIYLAVARTDGSVAHVSFQTDGRFPSQPLGGWRKSTQDFVWTRDQSDENIEYELARVNANWSRLGDPTMIGWKRLSAEEHAMFNADREYRDAMTLKAGKIEHDMPKARELHKARIRHLNGDKFMTMDREWVDANARGDTAEAAAVELRRKALRDAVNDPRIDEAKTLEELKVVTPHAVPQDSPGRNLAPTR